MSRNLQYVWQEDFEDGIAGWSVTGPATLSNSLTQSYNGERSLLVSVNNGAAGAVATTVVVSKLVALGDEGAADPGLYIDHRAMIRPSTVPSGLTVKFDSLGGTGKAEAPLVAGQWSWVRGGRQATTLGNVTAQFEIAVPAGAVFDLWIDYIRFEVRHQPEGAPIADRVVFALQPDGAEPMVDEWEYPTSVYRSRNGHEARQALRERPIRTLRFRATELDAVWTARMQAALWANGTGRWTVPYWPGARRATAISGDPGTGQAFTLNPAGAEFRVGEQAMVWRDPLTYDLMAISAVGSGSVTLTGTSTFTKRVGDLVIPAGPAVLEPARVIERSSHRSAHTTLTFEMETWENPVPAAGTLPQYQGQSLLFIEEGPGEESGEDWQQEHVRVGGATGAFQLRTGEPVPTLVRTLEWLLSDFSQIGTLKGFIAAFRGRRNGFWCPTYQSDLTPSATAASGATQLVIENSGYTDQQFPHKSRRDLLIYWPGGDWQAVRVTNAVDNGATETLTITPALTKAVEVGRGRVSFLTWCRLESDNVSIRFHTTHVATASMQVMEIPQETP